MLQAPDSTLFWLPCAPVRGTCQFGSGDDEDVLDYGDQEEEEEEQHPLDDPMQAEEADATADTSDPAAPKVTSTAPRMGTVKLWTQPRPAWKIASTASRLKSPTSST